MALQIDPNGVVSLPDGRVANTVAAAQFRLVQGPEDISIRLMRDNTKYSTSDEADQADIRFGSALDVEENLACGMTAAMYGVAEGRRLDGSVATAATWWKVCAL